MFIPLEEKIKDVVEAAVRDSFGESLHPILAFTWMTETLLSIQYGSG